MPRTPKIILIADDDLDDQELLEEAFLRLEEDAQIHRVFTGRELMEYLLNCADKSLPGLIVLDYNMPNMNGPEILDYLCRNERYKNIPAVIWSTSDSPYYKEICAQNGAKHYFSKPEDFLKITDMAKQMLRFCNGGQDEA